MRIRIKNKSHWHKLRLEHVGASEVAALFGHSDYLTEYGLYVMKRDGLEFGEETERQLLGNNLEAGIAKSIAQQEGWRIGKCKYYYSVDGMGATPDYEIYESTKSYKVVALLQIKNVSLDQWHEKWINQQPPFAYQLQVQQEMACTDIDVAYIGACIGGSELRVWKYGKHEKAIAAIRRKTTEFWESIKSGKEPDLSHRDLANVKRVYQGGGESVNITRYDACANVERIAMLKAKKKEIDAEIKKRTALLIRDDIKDATSAICGEYKINAGVVHSNGYSVPARSTRRIDIRRIKDD